MWPLIVFPALWVVGMVLIVRVFRPRSEPCDHRRNWTECRWTEGGTPMASFLCGDCGKCDRGHVHADPAKWLDGYVRCVDEKQQPFELSRVGKPPILEDDEQEAKIL